MSPIFFSTHSNFRQFKENVSVIKLSVSSILDCQFTGYRIYTVSREPIRLPEIQYQVFGT